MVDAGDAGEVGELVAVVGMDIRCGGRGREESGEAGKGRKVV